MKLTSEQWDLLQHCLWTARQEFQTDARTFDAAYQSRLAEQAKRQVALVDDLIDAVEQHIKEAKH